MALNGKNILFLAMLMFARAQAHEKTVELGVPLDNEISSVGLDEIRPDHFNINSGNSNLLTFDIH